MWTHVEDSLPEFEGALELRRVYPDGHATTKIGFEVGDADFWRYLARVDIANGVEVVETVDGRYTVPEHFGVTYQGYCYVGNRNAVIIVRGGMVYIILDNNIDPYTVLLEEAIAMGWSIYV